MKTKKRILNAAAKAAFSSAKIACGAASIFGGHQPKEPQMPTRQAK